MVRRVALIKVPMYQTKKIKILEKSEIFRKFCRKSTKKLKKLGKNKQFVYFYGKKEYPIYS